MRYDAHIKSLPVLLLLLEWNALIAQAPADSACGDQAGKSYSTLHDYLIFSRNAVVYSALTPFEFREDIISSNKIKQLKVYIGDQKNGESLFAEYNYNSKGSLNSIASFNREGIMVRKDSLLYDMNFIAIRSMSYNKTALCSQDTILYGPGAELLEIRTARPGDAGSRTITCKTNSVLRMLDIDYETQRSNGIPAKAHYRIKTAAFPGKILATGWMDEENNFGLYNFFEYNAVKKTILVTSHEVHSSATYPARMLRILYNENMLATEKSSLRGNVFRPAEKYSYSAGGLLKERLTYSANGKLLNRYHFKYVLY